MWLQPVIYILSQEIPKGRTSSVLIALISSLAGVIVGGVVTYFIQSKLSKINYYREIVREYRASSQALQKRLLDFDYSLDMQLYSNPSIERTRGDFLKLLKDTSVIKTRVSPKVFEIFGDYIVKMGEMTKGDPKALDATKLIKNLRDSILKMKLEIDAQIAVELKNPQKCFEPIKEKK